MTQHPAIRTASPHLTITNTHHPFPKSTLIHLLAIALVPRYSLKPHRTLTSQMEFFQTRVARTCLTQTHAPMIIQISLKLLPTNHPPHHPPPPQVELVELTAPGPQAKVPISTPYRPKLRTTLEVSKGSPSKSLTWETLVGPTTISQTIFKPGSIGVQKRSLAANGERQWTFGVPAV